MFGSRQESVLDIRIVVDVLSAASYGVPGILEEFLDFLLRLLGVCQ